MSIDYFIGFDPGLKGAYTVLDKHGDIVQVFDMPVVEIQVGGKQKNKVAPAAIASELGIFCHRDRCFAIIESVSARPGQGVTSVFSFGRSLGVLEGVLAGLKIPSRLVHPQAWTKEMKIIPGKDGSRQRAMELWPAKAELFKRAKDDGRSDSALIALYGMKNGN
jgi:crossover junction endodeoxyribonuclease RuvC